jgi:hypothetical protein
VTHFFPIDDEGDGFPLDDNETLSISDDEKATEDLSTERAPRFLGLLRLLRLLRRQRGCPTLRFPCAVMPNVCANMRNAIRLGKPTRLTRITNRSQIQRNRRNSGCRDLRPVSGCNCDEYPFASSLQGGAGAVVRLVPIRENSIQGGVLAAFYRRHRIGHGGCYIVRV